MQDITKLRIYKSLHIIYFIIEFLIFASPFLFVFISNLVEVNYADFRGKLGSNADKLIKLLTAGDENFRGEFWVLIKGWRFAVVVISALAGAVSYFWILRHRIINRLKNGAQATKDNIKNNNIMEMLEIMTLKNKIKDIKDEDENEKAIEQPE